MSICSEHSSFPDHEPCDRRQLHWERVVGSCASYADRVARSPLLWEDSHEAIGRSSMETALTSILSSETGSYFTLRRASLCDGAKRHALKGSSHRLKLIRIGKRRKLSGISTTPDKKKVSRSAPSCVYRKPHPS